MQSERGEFTAGADQEPPFLDVELAEAVTEGRIDVLGFTEPFSEVRVILNGNIARRVRSVGETGEVRFIGLALPLKTNTVVVQAFDPAGNQYEKTFNVIVDDKAPNIVISNFRPIITSDKITLKGTTDEFVTMEFFVGLEEDKVAPKRVKNLRAISPLGQNVVTLQWDDVEEEDFLEYNVFRDGMRIALVSGTEYKDVTVASGEGYKYRVSATDKSCNEGGLSDTLNVQTTEGGNENVTAPDEVESQCTKSVDTMDVAGSWQKELTLQPGPNTITIIAKDKAGNKFVYTNTTTFDSVPPIILEHNLGGLSPSYIKDVTVRGQVSERATVFVYIEGEPKHVAFGHTDNAGNFQIPFKLLKKHKTSKPGLGGQPTQFEFGTEEGWLNKIRLEAVDGAGLKSESAFGDVVYALCGFGSAFDVKITNPKPSTVNPRLVLDGFGKFGFNIDMKYMGLGKPHMDVPVVRLMRPSPDQAPNFDMNVQPIQRWSQDRFKGFVELTIEPPVFPESDAAHPNGWTTVMKERNISSHRRGQCIYPGLGCYKVPLQLEISYTAVTERLPGEEAVTGIVGPRAERQVQRVCIPVQVSIDQRVDPKIIPNSFLKASGKFFEGAIDVIDTILKPIEKIYEITFYGCLLGRFIGFFGDMNQKAACRTGLVGVIKSMEGGKFDRKVAEMGLCKLEYSDDTPEGEKALNNCVKCQKSFVKRRKMLRTLKAVCDRIMCPAVPSLQKWVADAQARGAINYGSVTTPSGKEITVRKGNDCAWVKTQDGKPIDPNSLESIKRIMSDFKERRGKKSSTGLSADGGYDPDDPNCANQHPADPRCCGYTYDEEWGTACLANNYEIKESFELAKEKDRGKPNTRRLYSSRSAVCNAKGTGIEQIPTNLYWTDPNDPELEKDVAARMEREADAKRNREEKQGIKESGRGRLGAIKVDKKSDAMLERKLSEYTGINSKVLPGVKHLSDHKIYITIEMDKNNLVIQRRYSVDESVIATNPAMGKRTDDRIPVTKTSSLVKYDPSENLAPYFQPGTDGKIPKYDHASWKKSICGKESCPRSELERVYNAIKSKVDGVNKDIIVDPSADLISAFKCGCVSGMVTHLKQWRGILTTIRSCFKSIEVTGDGTAGSCQALLSKYVCDFIYSLIKCYRGRFGIGNERQIGGTFHGMGAVSRNMAAAGSSVEQTLNARYGGNNMFRAVFSERKLVNSMCLFAFTGDWKLDPIAVLEAPETQFPVESQPFLNPCERRYITYDINNDFTEWNYHLGVDLFAGADLRYRLKLVCSDGYTCDPNEGFANGQCDCFGKGEKFVTVPLGTGQLKQFDNIGEAGEVFHNAQSKYRYDKARLEWTYRGKRGEEKKGQKECVFQEQGGGPPLDCAFDILTDTYKCGSEAISQYFAKFVRDPQPLYPDNEFEIFILYDDIKFEVPILQRLPDRAECTGGNVCSDSKFLIYTIKNQQGAIVWTNDEKYTEATRVGDRATTRANLVRLPYPPRVLETQGERAYVINLGSLTADDINAASGGLSTPWETAPQGNDLAVMNVQMTALPTENLVFVFNTDVPEQFFIYDAPKGKSQKEPGDNPGFVKLIRTRRVLNPTKTSSGDWELRYQKAGSSWSGTVTINGRHKGRQIEVFIPSNPETIQKKLCDPTDIKTQNKEYTWHGTFEIRDSAAAGLGAYKLSDQTSMAAGDKQARIIPFKIACGSDRKVASGRVRVETFCKENTPGRGGCVCKEDIKNATTMLQLRNKDRAKFDAMDPKESGACGPGDPSTCVDGQCLSSATQTICRRGTKLTSECLCGVAYEDVLDDKGEPVIVKETGKKKTKAVNQYCKGTTKAPQECFIPYGHAQNYCVPWGKRTEIEPEPETSILTVIQYAPRVIWDVNAENWGSIKNKLIGMTYEEFKDCIEGGIRKCTPAKAQQFARWLKAMKAEFGLSLDDIKRWFSSVPATTQSPGAKRYAKLASQVHPNYQRPVYNGQPVVNEVMRRAVVEHYKPVLVKYANQYNMKPEWLAAVIHRESSWNNVAISISGCIGLMQVCQDTGKAITNLPIVRCCSKTGSETTITQCTDEHKNLETQGLNAFQCPSSEIRFDGDFKIHAGTKAIAAKLTDFTSFTDKHKFMFGAYNIGKPVRDAVNALVKQGNTNPKFDEAVKYLKDHPDDILGKYSVYADSSTAQRIGKIEGMERYVNDIMKYIALYEPYFGTLSRATPPQAPGGYVFKHSAIKECTRGANAGTRVVERHVKTGIDASGKDIIIENFYPIRLCDVPEGSGPGKIRVNVEIEEKVDDMVKAAAAKNIFLKGGSYRSTAKQKSMREEYERAVARGEKPAYVAKPYTSRHEMGLAVDFGGFSGIPCPDSAMRGTKKVCIAPHLPHWVWLRDNADKYGLYQLNSEVWHWSVDGK
ncbi:MAG: D-alanyl-D-alanine carboxypeptidase family protein [Candidatus Nanoarchaeia archaeon]